MIWFFLFSLLSQTAFAVGESFEWKADYYERDNRTNSIKGRGNAWYREGKTQIWADEIEINFTTKWAYATGNAHFNDGENDIFCDRGAYALSGTEAVLEEATIVSGQMVLSGGQIRKISKDRFEMDEGFYTNCNTIPIKDRSASKCPFDWKIYGKHFQVTFEGYAHIYDALIYTKELPVLYIPYYIAPAKAKRQSGFLWIESEVGRDIGSGMGIPYYLVLGPWHDVTFSPTLYSNAGMHLGVQYAYAYSRTKQGTVSVYGTQYQYSDTNRAARPFGKRSPGIGEYAINIDNKYSLGGRAHSRQQIRLVSDPFYPRDFVKEMGSYSDFSGLRSQITATVPTDNHLFTGQVTYFQSLVMPMDERKQADGVTPGPGVDRGAVTQLPTLSYYKKSTPTPLKFLSYEIDTRFSNFYRSDLSFDSVPGARNENPPGSSVFNGASDYVREGKRLIVEPRAVFTFPIASGMQLQPVVRGGSLLYHFDVPNSTFANQYYADAEVPFQMYLAKNFETGIKGLEKIRHIFQPRIIYAASLYRNQEDTATSYSHPFFRRTPFSNPEAFSNPRFDIYDQTTRFEYMRIELINRLFRDVNGGRERFLTVSVANQFNSRVSETDPRFRSQLGPIEMLVDFVFAPLSINFQGIYQLTKKEDGVNATNESDWTGNITYAFDKDRLSIDGLYRVRLIPNDNAHEYTFRFYKTLPVFLDLTGSVTYNARTSLDKSLKQYDIGLLFSSKPASCWTLGALYTKNIQGESFARFVFGLSFGGTFSFSSASMNK